MTNDDPSRPALDYRAPDQPSPRSRTLEAILLCIPGLMCWCLFLTASRWPHAVERALWPFPPKDFFWTLWLVAVCTAMVSVVRYAALRLMTPAVIFNLLVNVSGLLFSCLALLSAL